MILRILQFAIDAQRYGLALDTVVEVVRAVALARLPAAPRIVEGVIDLRGRIVPVLDLRTRFRHASRPIQPSDHLIIARSRDRTVAMRVDRALDITTMSRDDVEPIEDSVPRASYVAGIAKTPDGLVLIHDIATFLSQAESEELERALVAAGGASA